MRIIGHIPNKEGATAFGDYLYVEGIRNTIEGDNGRWAVWIHSEEELEKAKELLAAFLGNPSDNRYRERSRKAEQLRDDERQSVETAQERQFDRRRLFRGSMPYGVGVLTFLLVLACVGVSVVSRWGEEPRVIRQLQVSEVPGTALSEVKNGQVWRVVTPIFVHYGLPHLFFNMLCLLDLGSMVEGRQGTWRLLYIVLFIATLSNLAEYFYSGANFGGMSGVVYGLLGYIWLRGKFDPGSGLALRTQTVVIMLVWFFLCLTGKMGNVANMVHAVGLAVGMAWGFLSSFAGRRAPPLS